MTTIPPIKVTSSLFLWKVDRIFLADSFLSNTQRNPRGKSSEDLRKKRKITKISLRSWPRLRRKPGVILTRLSTRHSPLRLVTIMRFITRKAIRMTRRIRRSSLLSLNLSCLSSLISQRVCIII